MAKTELVFGELSGGGQNATTGIIQSSNVTSSAEMTIDTGLKGFTRFIIYYQADTGSNALGSFISWESSTSNYFRYVSGAGSNVGSSNYATIPQTSNTRYGTVKSIDATNGTIKIQFPSNDTWSKRDWTWIAIKE